MSNQAVAATGNPANGDMARLESALGEMSDELIRQGWWNEQLQESLRELELALTAQDWRLLSGQAQQEFSTAGLQQIRELARLMYLKNPVIKRGVDLQRLYVWALGVNIAGREPEINDCIQSFLDDERNQDTLSGHQARMKLETDLQLDGGVFFRFFVNRADGRVRVRTLPPGEVTDIVFNPEDASEPWFYRRQYSRVELSGAVGVMTEYYPDWNYQPAAIPAGFSDGALVMETPVYHVAVNKFGRFGVPEVYAALDWALAYKTFLENLATVWRALSRWAAKLQTTGGARGIAAAKAKLNTTISTSTDETNPPPVTGSVFISGEGTNLEPFRTSGATMSAEDGRRLFLMAAAVMGFPETFYGDVSVGTLATAESLDRPTELKVRDRQALWTSVLQAIFTFVCRWAVKAPAGSLRSLGRVVREPDGGEIVERLEWNEGVDGNIDISWPPIVERDLASYVSAAVEAATLAGVPKNEEQDWLRTFVRLLLSAFEVADADEIVERIFAEPVDAEPEPEPPQPVVVVQSPAEEPEEDEENPVEEALREAGKPMQIGDETIDPRLQTYYDELAALTEEANRGRIDREEFEKRAREMVLAMLMLSFLLGGGNIADPAAEAALATERSEALTSVSRLADDIYAGAYQKRAATDDQPGQSAETAENKLGSRLRVWTGIAAGVFALGMLHAAGDQTYEWELGNTSEHCGDCLALAGQVHTAAEWRASGFRPQGRSLECGGWNCDCRLKRTDKKSQGMTF